MSYDYMTTINFMYICPKCFDIKQRDIYAIEYNMKNTGNDLSSFLAETQNSPYQYVSPNLLLHEPNPSKQ